MVTPNRPRFDVVARVAESRPVEALLSGAARALRSRRPSSAPFPAGPPIGAATRPGVSADASAEQQAHLKHLERRAPLEPGSVAAFARAYRDRSASPVEVADEVLRAIAASEAGPAMRFFISLNADDVRAQASASAARHAAGAPLSVLDGVPVAVKDEVDQQGHATTLGTTMSALAGMRRSDCVAVARLRALGAVLIGKANMHELGAGPTGLNLAHGTCRNPWDPTRFPGGSSSGSAALVAAGLTPLSVGCDGGGSIRIPASLCGVVGLKPTFGRVPQRGETPPLATSVTNIGPMGRTVTDTAIGYVALAGPDSVDGPSVGLPAVTLDGFDDRELHGVTLGMVDEWWRDADAAVVAVCEAHVARLVARGARLREVRLNSLRDVLLGLVSSIGVEVNKNEWMSDVQQRRALAVDTRVGLVVARHLGPRVYRLGQRSRARVAAVVEAAQRDIDALVSPTTGLTAPLIPQVQSIGDVRQTVALMKATALANVTGQPGISYPVGNDKNGMPIGLQLVGRPYEEALLLRVARIGEEEASSSSWAPLSSLPPQATRRAWRILPA